MGNVRVAQIVPANIVDGATRRLAELVLIEFRLDQVFDRGVARHAVIDDEEAPLALALLERGGEAIAPGVAFAGADIVGRRAAEGRHDIARRELARRRIAAARALRGVADRKAGGAGEAQRGDGHGLQQGVPLEALRLRLVRRQQRGGAERRTPERVRTDPPAEVDQRQDQQGAGEPRPAHERDRKEEERQQVEEVDRARAERGEFLDRHKPAGHQEDGDRHNERHDGDDRPFETVGAVETDIGEHPVRHVGPLVSLAGFSHT